MPGWLPSAGSGPLTWMLSSATLTAWIAWINQHQRKGRREGNDAAQTANVTKEKRNKNKKKKKKRKKTAGPKPKKKKRKKKIKIKVPSLYVDDQDKALRFYTEV